MSGDLNLSIAPEVSFLGQAYTTLTSRDFHWTVILLTFSEKCNTGALGRLCARPLLVSGFDRSYPRRLENLTIFS